MSAPSQQISHDSQIVPALMLAAMLAITGLETLLVFASPQPVAARPAMDARHDSRTN